MKKMLQEKHKAELFITKICVICSQYLGHNKNSEDSMNKIGQYNTLDSIVLSKIFFIWCMYDTNFSIF